MKPLQRLALAVTLAITSLSVATASPAAQVASEAPAYRVEVVATGLYGAVALAVNEAGDVVGWQSVNGSPRAFFWSEGVLTLLPTPSDRPLSIARDVNDNGVVVGSAYTSALDEPGHAMRWTRISTGIWTVQDLGVLPDDAVSEALGVNNLGQVVGHSNPRSFLADHGFLHTDITGLTPLNAVSAIFVAYDVNDFGVAVGTGSSRAQRVDVVTGVAQDLGVLAPYGLSHAYALNDLGQVAGVLTAASGNSQVVARYADPTGWQVLGGLGETNIGWGINSAGTVVGEGWPRTGSLPSKRAVIFLDSVGALLYVDDLLEPGSEWSISRAFDINDAGQIAGYARNKSTSLFAAVRLSPAGLLPDLTAPGAPTLNAAIGSVNSVRLAWSAGPNGGSVITSYRVYRGTEPGGENLVTPVATVGTVLSYTDNTATFGFTYYYKVSAVNGVGEGALSVERFAAPTALAVPGTPTLKAKTAAVRNPGVQLDWSSPPANGSAISAFRIYRGTSPGGEIFFRTKPAGTRAWRDTGTVSGRIYYYKVSAVNANGEGSLSIEAFAKAR